MNRPLCALALLATLAGCASGGTSVRRMDVNEVKDLSGRWNDTDSRLVAEELIADSLSRPWLQRASVAGKQPAVIVQKVRNQSLEHINTDTFVEDLQRALINSGRVSFVASKSERGQLREERLDQDANASEETRKAQGQETGADFSLNGVINAVQDREGGEVVMLYQVNLKLTDLKSNQIVWNGQKKIKKDIQRPAAGW
ncbi:MAG TPA: penicillin-binding protein activator LpoB [Anaeromyxobacteraceae bacterium]|nr:penicillin-binding protein activator LpoB [Anaeromyxobacteraceae bacterium]